MGYLVGFANHLSYAGENLAVVYLDANADSETTEHLINDLHQFHLAEQRVASHHIGITLIELAIASFLRTVGSPNGLNLITTERQSQFLTMLNDITGEGNSQIVSETLFAKLGCKVSCCA